MKQTLTPETKVGLFLIVGIALILGVFVTFGGLFRSNETTYPINIIFKDSAGLIKDSQLRMGGIPIGKLTKNPELMPSGNEVILEASIQRGINIQEGSVFRIDMQNILGDKYIDIVPPSSPASRFIQPNETVIGQSESDLSKIKNNAVNASEEILKLLTRIEGNYDQIDEVIRHIGEAAQGIAQTTKIVNEQVLKPETIVKLDNILASIEQSGQRLPDLIQSGEAGINEMRQTIQTANQLLGKIEKSSDHLDPAIQELATTLHSLKTASDNIAAVSGEFRKNQGFWGLIMYDKEFRIQAQEFIRNLRDYGILRYRNPSEPQIKSDPRSGMNGSRR